MFIFILSLSHLFQRESPVGRDKLTLGVKPAARGWVDRRQCKVLVVSSMGKKVGHMKGKEGCKSFAKEKKKRRRRKSIRNVCKEKNKAKGMGN